MSESIGYDIDRLYAVRGERKAREAEVADLLRVEKELEAKIIEKLSSQKLTGAKGSWAQFSITEVEVPKVTNWPDLYNFIRLNNAFELLHKRIGVTEWAVYREEGIIIPGTEVLQITKSSLRKIS
jgi:hypothetical protein